MAAPPSLLRVILGGVPGEGPVGPLQVDQQLLQGSAGAGVEHAAAVWQQDLLPCEVGQWDGPGG